jgi:molybdenum cofactor biosynthesis protein B
MKHSHGHDAEHERAERRRVRVLTVTVSDTRTEANDEGGAGLRQLLTDAGYSLVPHRITPDDPERLRAIVLEACERDLADAIVTTGGTGVGPRDSTLEALEPLFEKRLEGFGEIFRNLSFRDVGPRAILSRAAAGVVRGRFVAALPGSPRAVALAVTEVLAPTLAHAVALLGGRTRHGGG